MELFDLLSAANFHPLRLKFPDSWIGHIPFGAWLIRALKPSVFVELGTHSGNSYFTFCQAVKEEHLSTRCFAVDTWKGDEHSGYYGEEVFQDVDFYNRSNYSAFSRLLRMTFDEAARYFSDGSIDLLHIDGLHTYEAVKHDFKTWFPKLSKHALVLFHDTNVRERNFGVWKLWEELCQEYPLNFEFFHSHGLGIIQLSKAENTFNLEWLSADFPHRQIIRDYFSALGQWLQEEYSKQKLEDSLKMMIIEHNQNIETLKSKIRERESGLEKIQADLAASREQVTKQVQQNLSLRRQIELLQHELDVVRAQVQERDQAFQNLNYTLQDIYNSTAWDIIQWMWRIRLFLFPRGSRREKLGKGIYKIMISLKNFRNDTKTNKLEAQPADHQSQKKEEPDNSRSESKSLYPYKRVYDQLFRVTKREKSADYIEISGVNLANEDFPVKLIAFYLPQFHPIPENDLWWGKGFTEWTNVTRAIPLFEGHYQPHLPGEFGFYDLRVKEVQERQVELAKKYGIRGFCFYYYWFSGKKLLDLPLRQFMENEQIDFPFCIMWANENWTRRWDGLDNEILIAQDETLDESIRFIEDVLPIISHKNYIKIDGRPLLMVYNPRKLIDCKLVLAKWREYCLKNGVENPYVVAAQTFGYLNHPEDDGFDALVEFPPHLFPANGFPLRKIDVEILCQDFQGKLFDYSALVQFYIEKDTSSSSIFKTVVPMWDNTARKANAATVYLNSTPALFSYWLKKAIDFTLSTKRHPHERLVFINAWNEWAEGNHLEPDLKYGYAFLQKIADTLVSYKSRAQKKKVILFLSHDAHLGGAQQSLLGILKWLNEHTYLTPKVLLLDGGKLIDDFKQWADVLVLPIDSRLEYEWLGEVINFCDGVPALVYGNTTVSTKAYPALRKLGVPILTHVRELASSIQRYSPGWEKNIHNDDCFIAVSHAVKQHLVHHIGIPEDKILVIYNFIKNADRQLPSLEEKVSLRRKLNLLEDGFLVVGSGIGMPFRKGVDLFYKVAENLLAMQIKDFHFYWVGGEFDYKDISEDGTTWEKTKRQYENSSIRNYVTILGVKENVMDYFRAADAFILTSREDPFARVVLEAAAAGLPILAFEKGGGAPEFIQDDAGFIAPEYDVKFMAEKIALLIKNEDFRMRLGKNALTKVQSFHVENKIMPQILSVIRELGHFEPYVSIIVPNYNHAKYLPRRMESIFNQTFRDFEVILMDDCSTDESVYILEQYSSLPNVTLIKNDQNSGSPFKQWLKAFRLVKGDIVWIAESDDWCEPNFLERLLPAFQDPQVGLAYCASKIVNENDEVIGDYRDTDYLRSISENRWNSSYIIWGEEEVNEAMGIKNTILNISSVLFRKFKYDEDFEKTLENMHVGGDTYLLLNVMKNQKVQYEAAALNYHRRHKTSIVGKILSERDEKLLRLFFRDFYTNHLYTIKNYSLSIEYYNNFNSYIRNLWNTLQPNKPFEDIEEYFPFQEFMDMLYKVVTQRL